MLQPTLQKVQEIAALHEYKKVPILKEIYSDFKTPIEVLRVLRSVSSHCYMLESIENSEKWGRYTFLGFDPKLELTCTNGTLTVNTGMKFEMKTTHPAEYIRKIIAENKSPKLEGFPSFTGGLVGYFAYDYIKYSEPKLELEAGDEEKFKDVDLMLFDKVIAFDHFRNKMIFIVNMDIEDETILEVEYNRAEMEIEKMIHLVRTGKPADIPKGVLKSEIRALFSKEEYCQMVEKAKHYIREGDIFQVVLSNRLEADFEGSLFDTYRVLRTINPSPYMFYFSGEDMEIAGASPETLVKLQDGTLHTFPLAGTRPRGKNEAEDKELEAGLKKDEKERAEHNMLVDLGRNDIGKISEFRSVEVERYMDILKYSHVMHIGSTVKGTIRKDKDALDAVDAVLPAGTLSGAPKIRACEIINELEKNKRGIYGGAIGYIDFTGNLDTAIAIRIAYKKNNKVYVRSGAGIVADSVPEMEYQECLNKARAALKALEIAQEGLE
jgi:anthranilate synthase component 1